MPGMFMPSEGASPSANLMEVQASEAQGHPSRGGVCRQCEAKGRADEQKLDRRRLGRTSARESTKSISIKDQRRKSSGCAPTGHELTPGGLRWVGGGQRTEPDCGDKQLSLNASLESAVGIVGTTWC